jgi:ceramide synthetase
MGGMDDLEIYYREYLPYVGAIWLSLLTVRFIWTKISPSIVPLPAHIGEEKKNNTRLSILYLLQLVGSVVFGEYVSRGQKWRLDYDECFVGWTPDLKIDEGVQWFYCWQLAFYCYLLTVLFLEEKKKDFVVMGIHHVITILLVSGAIVGRVQYIGAVLMLSFDKCDVLLEAAKIFNRLEWHATAASTFVLFVLAWIVYRVIEYPIYIIYAASRAHIIAGREVPAAPPSTILLAIIYVMQVYWSYFIIKKVIGFAKKGIKDGDDPRESDFKEFKEKQKKGN